MDNKGQTGIISLVIGLVIGVILLVGVLIPITSDTVADQNFTGTNATIADNLTTFILIGKQSMPTFAVMQNEEIPEKNWKAEMPIRTEGYTEYSQVQRIGDEKIQFSHEAGTTLLWAEKIC
jgi:hypothetical protein